MSTSQVQEARRLAGLELSAMRYAGALPADAFEGAKVAARGTPVHDIGGELLFYRFAVSKRGAAPAFADIAVHSAIGAPLIAVSSGLDWDEKALLAEAEKAARKGRGRLRYDSMRFVAYSFPKVGVQLLADGEEVLLLELGSWAAVAPAPKKDREPLQPSNFERWSLLEELPAGQRSARTRRYKSRVAGWSAPQLERLKTSVVSEKVFQGTRVGLIVSPVEESELHYADDSGHFPCFELYGQLTEVWCVAASVQMLLAFYRYGYTQQRIASALGLGTISAPQGLPYSRDGDVVTQLEALSSRALDATMVSGPNFTFFRDEIRANRPLISFIPGHSRCVAGYLQYRVILFPGHSTRFLLVYDPWPPTTGVITRWENCDAQTYRVGFSAHVALV